MTCKIEALIEQIIRVTKGWIKKDVNGSYIFEDPNDHQEISAHYGASHMAASLILWGTYKNDKIIYVQGVELLKNILDKWEQTKKEPSFHFDFNNLALTLVEDKVGEELSEKIRYVLMHTDDSHHDTVNWLPMRWVVNKKRLEWSQDSRYKAKIDYCKKTIEKATNADGGIEDRLPYGISFNLQYDLATVAVLQYLHVQGENIDLSKELGFLINAIAPDGDINYQGRGTNQIFAWGLWVYLLSSSGQESHLDKALDYLSPRLNLMLHKNSMMLNEWEGKEKYLWWDYHYASVYVAHCLLWLILAVMDYKKSGITPYYSNSSETGLHIYKSASFFASHFDGRKEYLAEKGPAIAAIWSKKQGMICKGTFAPWQGAFGNSYIYDDIVLKNYCGLLSVNRNKDFTKNKYLHKLFSSVMNDDFCSFKPLFCPIIVNEELEKLKITWKYNGSEEFIFSLPSIKEKCDINLYVDGKPVNVFCTQAIKNQYGWAFLHQSRTVKGHQVILIIQ